MASAEFDDKTAEKRPAVQVGDPFMEKLLLEACLEVMQTDALVGIQDMGAAGLTCSTTEMGSRGGAGIEIDVSLVPQRETGMTPYEIMLSESQERMLLVVKQGREAEVERIFEKWDLHAVRIGEVTDDGMLRVKERGDVVAEIPNRALTDEAPVYHRPMPRLPTTCADVQTLDLDALERRRRSPGRVPANDALLSAARRRRPSPASTGSTGSTTTWCRPTRSTCPGWAPACVRIKGTDRALAMSVDGNGRYCYLDPHLRRDAGGRRSLPQRGLRRRAPARRHQLPELRQPRASGDHVAVRQGGRGLSARPAGRLACRSPAATSASTTRPTAARSIRRRSSASSACSSTPIACSAGGSRSPGDAIVLLGEGRGELGGSEYLKLVHGLVRGMPPALDLDAERALQTAARGAGRPSGWSGRRTTAPTAALR